MGEPPFCLAMGTVMVWLFAVGMTSPCQPLTSVMSRRGSCSRSVSTARTPAGPAPITTYFFVMLGAYQGKPSMAHLTQASLHGA